MEREPSCPSPVFPGTETARATVVVSPRPISPARRSASSSSSARASIPLAQIAGSVRSSPTSSRELLGRARAAGAEELEVRLDHRVALLHVAAVDREREEVAVRVGVDVPRRAREVRDVAPPRRVPLDRDRVAEERGLRLDPELADPLGRDLALPRGAPCARRARSGSSRSGGTSSRSRPRSGPPGGRAGASGRPRSARSRSKVSASPNTDAVSAVVSGVDELNRPSGCASTPWRPCPSSCARVRIERRSPV